jgi:hypothetical protein
VREKVTVGKCDSNCPTVPHSDLAKVCGKVGQGCGLTTDKSKSRPRRRWRRRRPSAEVRAILAARQVQRPLDLAVVPLREITGACLPLPNPTKRK